MGKTAIEGASRDNAFWVEPERITIITDPNHALYDERALDPPDADLARDLDENGNHSAVILWKDGQDLVLVAGRGRTLAALLVQEWRSKKGEPPFRLRARIEKGTLKQMQHIMFSENAHRRNLTPIGRARQMERAIRRFGWTEEELASALHCSVATVKSDMALLDCAPEVQQAADAKPSEGGISASVAKQLSNLPREKQVETLKEMRKKGLTKGTKATRAVKAAKQGREIEDKGVAKKMRPRAVLEEWYETLSKEEKENGGLIFMTARQVVEFVLGGDKSVLHDRLVRTLKALK